jgi:hypothetical protein
VATFDFSSEKLPGSEYGLIRQKDNKKNTPQYRRYPSNVQWDPEDPRLMALEIYLHQQKLDLSASINGDDKTYDLLLTSRSVGDGDSTIAATHVAAARDSVAANQEDLVNYFLETVKIQLNLYVALIKRIFSRLNKNSYKKCSVTRLSVLKTDH